MLKQLKRTIAILNCFCDTREHQLSRAKLLTTKFEARQPLAWDDLICAMGGIAWFQWGM